MSKTRDTRFVIGVEERMERVVRSWVVERWVASDGRGGEFCCCG